MRRRFRRALLAVAALAPVAASGAQINSTDDLTAPNVHGNAYHPAPFPKGWRCSPVAKECTP